MRALLVSLSFPPSPLLPLPSHPVLPLFLSFPLEYARGQVLSLIGMLKPQTNVARFFATVMSDVVARNSMPVTLATRI